MALDEQQRLERAARIRQLREDSPYTQEALAEKCGVKLRSYQKWEEGGGIDWDHLEALAEIHGVDVRWIHKGAGRQTPDLLTALNGDSTAQLNRIEARLEQIATALKIPDLPLPTEAEPAEVPIPAPPVADDEELQETTDADQSEGPAEESRREAV